LRSQLPRRGMSGWFGLASGSRTSRLLDSSTPRLSVLILCFHRHLRFVPSKKSRSSEVEEQTAAPWGADMLRFRIRFLNFSTFQLLDSSTPRLSVLLLCFHRHLRFVPSKKSRGSEVEELTAAPWGASMLRSRIRLPDFSTSRLLDFLSSSFVFIDI